MNRLPCRRIVQHGVILLMAIILAQTFVAIGWLQPVVISGGSMAPRYVGEHRIAACSVCNCQQAIDTSSRQARCPNCDAIAEISGPHPGDYLFITRWNSQQILNVRWRPIVFRSPFNTTSLMVKRVLGLPGELVHFDDGDLWIDGDRVVKSLDEQLALRIRNNRLPATDDHAWNAHLSRQLNEVSDLMVEFIAKGSAEWSIEFSERCKITRSSSGKLEAFSTTGEQLFSGDVSSDKAVRWVISTFDSVLLIGADDHVLCHQPLEPSKIGNSVYINSQALGEGDELQELSVWRDVYYEAAASAWRIGPNELFVVGDNQAISVDSRNWEAPAGLPARLVIGQPR